MLAKAYQCNQKAIRVSIESCHSGRVLNLSHVDARCWQRQLANLHCQYPSRCRHRLAQTNAAKPHATFNHSRSLSGIGSDFWFGKSTHTMVAPPLAYTVVLSSVRSSSWYMSNDERPMAPT